MIKTAENYHVDEDLAEDDEDLAQINKYITFKLDAEEYAVDIFKVKEIIGLQSIVSLPDMPSCILGVINLRGAIIPIFNLRRRFGLDQIDSSERTCIIVVDIGVSPVGIMVDEVSEVLDILPEQIEAPPSHQYSAAGNYIDGIGKIGRNVKIILNVDRLLGDVAISCNN